MLGGFRGFGLESYRLRGGSYTRVLGCRGMSSIHTAPRVYVVSLQHLSLYISPVMANVYPQALSSSFFYGLYSESYKVIPKRNYLGAYGYLLSECRQVCTIFLRTWTPG